MLFDYDDRNIDSIFNYAQKLKGKTFREILYDYNTSEIKSYVNYFEFPNKLSEKQTTKNDSDAGKYLDENAKGQLGNFLEKYYFGYEPNSSQKADFPKVGMELKMTPIDCNNDKTYRAGERLSITNISFEEPVIDDFYQSHVYEKTKCILLIQYIRDKSKTNRLDYIIKYVNIFKPLEISKEDRKIIIDDYNKINNKIKEGRAHELSESDTMYLGACTKGSTAKDSERPQYYGDHTLAKKRNYCLKNSYMNYMLKNYISPGLLNEEKIINNDLGDYTFEEYIQNKINNFIGKTDKELCALFGREYNNNKAQWIDLAFRMLGIKSNKAQEFEKARIVVKTIRIEENGKNKESISLPPFKFKELAKETWEESSLREYLETTKFFFVVFRKYGDCYKLEKCKLWNMPYSDLNNIVQDEWNEIKKIINEGVKFSLCKTTDGYIVKNNLPGISDGEIIHIRPHAKQAAYQLKNGFKTGEREKNADELPNGEWMTAQSFWIKNEYILKQLYSDDLWRAK